MIAGEYENMDEAYRHLSKLQAMGERVVIERI